jgi:hypothetical protein
VNVHQINSILRAWLGGFNLFKINIDGARSFFISFSEPDHVDVAPALEGKKI